MQIRIVRNSYDIFFDQSKALLRAIKDETPVIRIAAPIIYVFLGGIGVFVAWGNSFFGKSFWGIDTVIWLTLLLTGIIAFRMRYSTKKAYLLKTRNRISNLNIGNKPWEILITEEYISTKGESYFAEMKWSYFSHIKETKERIFIMVDKYYDSGIIIDKAELNDAELKELKDFILNLRNVRTSRIK